MSLGRLQQVIEQQRKALLLREQAAVSPLVRGYGGAWREISTKVDALVADIDIRRKAGEEITAGKLARLRRLQDLKAQVADKLTNLSDAASRDVQAAQHGSVLEARKHVLELAKLSAGKPPPAASGVFANWNALPAEAVAHLVGAASDGSPLANLFARVAGEGATAFGDTLVKGLVQGDHPSVIARDLRREFGTPMAQSMRIARTETIRAYREANRQEMLANTDVVKGWTWHSALGSRTCPACWAMHGTVHPLDEMLDGHPNCRCAMVPLTKSWEELGFPGFTDTRPTIPFGEERFDAASKEVQQAVLGKAAFERFERGHLFLTDTLARSHSEEWGTMRYARSLKAIDEGTGGKWVGAAARATTANTVKEKTAAQVAREELLSVGPKHQAMLEDIKARRAKIAEDIDTLTDKVIALPYGDEREAGNKEIERLAEEMDKLTIEFRTNVELPRRKLLDVLAQKAPNLAPQMSPNTPVHIQDAIAEGLEEFGKLIGNIEFGADEPEGGFFASIPTRVSFRFEKGVRAHFAHADNTVVLGDGDVATVVHELGHWYEERVSRISKRAHDFLDRRTAGEAERKLADITGNKFYNDREVAKPDKFFNAYVGKIYKHNATEIVSMGLEKMYADPVGFAEDEDYFDFIFDLVREGR